MAGVCEVYPGQCPGEEQEGAVAAWVSHGGSSCSQGGQQLLEEEDGKQ